MIQMQTVMNVADNSGAQEVRCIKVLKGTHRKVTSVGDVVVVSIKRAIPRSKVKKGGVYKAVIVRVAKEFNRVDGSTVKFDSNACVLVNAKNEPIGTRIFGFIPRELRYLGFMRIVSLAPEVL